MSWASLRRLIITAVILSVGVAILAGVLIATIYQTPSCNDGKQNQDETGVDCGGSCVKACRAEVSLPTVDFVRPISVSATRTDVIAYLENPNASVAVSHAAYTVELYDANQNLLGTRQGRVDLAPTARVPIFLPNFFMGSTTSPRAFLTFDESSLTFIQNAVRTNDLTVSDVVLEDALTTPRITAVVKNSSLTPYRNVLFVAVVYDAAGNEETVIAASQTVAEDVPSRGSAALTFSWNTSFIGTVGRIEIRPVLPLP